LQHFSPLSGKIKHPSWFSDESSPSFGFRVILSVSGFILPAKAMGSKLPAQGGPGWKHLPAQG
jgi:hypothetical protein